MLNLADKILEGAPAPRTPYALGYTDGTRAMGESCAKYLSALLLLTMGASLATFVIGVVVGARWF